MTLPTVVFITALPCEFKAVAQHLSARQDVEHPEGTIYQVAEYPAHQPQWHCRRDY